MKALVAGGSGLVGGHLVDLLLNDARYEQVIVVGRTPLNRQHPKLENRQVDFLKLEETDLQADHFFCCLGTTIRKAGSQEKFKQVDHDYPLALAKKAQAVHAAAFLIVTALGADRNSGIFYNRIKGEVEVDIAALQIPSLHIFQPSMLLGDRKEERTGESAGKFAMKLLDFLIPLKYKAIESRKVARAMQAAAWSGDQGVSSHSSGEMQGFNEDPS